MAFQTPSPNAPPSILEPPASLQGKTLPLGPPPTAQREQQQFSGTSGSGSCRGEFPTDQQQKVYYSRAIRPLMHRVQHAAPSRARRQMHQRVKDPHNSLSKRTISIIRTVRIHRPIDQEGPPHDGIAIHEAPVAAVQAVIPVIAHG